MKIELTEQGPVKKTMAIEVEAEEMARETEAVLRNYARQARIPGFRPGKAPLAVIRARFGNEVRDDVRDRVMTRCFREAAREKGLRPLGDPVVDDVTQVEGGSFRFQVSFEVLPEIELKNYKGIEVRQPAVRVSDADVETALEELRQSQVRLLAEPDRLATTGDVIVCDLRGTPNDGEPFERERMLIEVGAPQNPPAFNDKLEGARAGSELDFNVDYPEGYETAELAGKSVRYELHVHEVKIRQVPELDDEFAKDLGDFEDLQALRQQLRQDLEARGRRDIERQTRQTVLDKVLLEHPVVLPAALVEDEVRHRLEEGVRRLMLQGIDPEKVDLDWKRLREQQEEPARKSVHARLILDAVARREEIEVASEEVEARIRRDAEAMNEKVETLRKHLKKGGGMEALKNQMVREKSLDLLIAVANIQTEE